MQIWSRYVRYFESTKPSSHLWRCRLSYHRACETGHHRGSWDGPNSSIRDSCGGDECGLLCRASLREGFRRYNCSGARIVRGSGKRGNFVFGFVLMRTQVQDLSQLRKIEREGSLSAATSLSAQKGLTQLQHLSQIRKVSLTCKVSLSEERSLSQAATPLSRSAARCSTPNPKPSTLNLGP